MPPQSTAKSGAGNRVAFGCMILFALPFAGGGLLALVQGIRQYPTKPGAIAIWVFAVLWNAISIPAAFAARPELTKGNLAALLVLLFPLIGIILLITAIYLTLRMMTFGTSTCHLERIPIAPGSTFRGDIELNIDTAPENGYRLRIASFHAVTTGSGKNRS